jgi:hypothetical protein
MPDCACDEKLNRKIQMKKAQRNLVKFSLDFGIKIHRFCLLCSTLFLAGLAKCYFPDVICGYKNNQR